MTHDPHAGARTARRLTVRRWRDPRLLTGIALVLGATALGARLAVAQDDTGRYWAVRDDVAAGQPVAADDLVPERVVLSGSAAEHYLPVDAELPARLGDLVWSRDVAGGTLVEGSAWGPADQGSGQLPLRVAMGAAPTDLRVGERVDVWVGPGPGDDATTPAEQLLSGVRVVDPGDGGSALGTDLTRTVLVDLGSLELTGDDLAAVSARHVTLVRVP